MTNLNFNTYLLKKIALDGSSFGGLTAGNVEQFTSLSVFNSATLEDLKNLDIASLLASDNSLDALDENASTDQKALAEMVKAFFSIDGVAQAADADKNGELDADEALEFLKSAMSFDGDLTNLTMDDLDNVIQSLNIDLDEVIDNAIEESLGLDAEEALEETQKPVETSNVGGNSGNVGGNYNSGASRTSTSQTKSTEDTVSELEQKISEKETEFSETEAEAEAQIQEQEDAKKQAMENAGVSEKEYQAYQEKEQELEKSITEQDKEIDTHNEKISQNEATISSNENYISSLDSQIANNQTALGAVAGDDEDATSKKAGIQEKIDNLEAKKKSVEKDNKKLKEENVKEKQAVQQAENKKKQLETQKQELLSKTLNDSTGFAKGVGSSQAVEQMKEQIAQYDTKIADIRSEKNEKVATIREEIKELNVQLQDAKQKDERDGFMRENSFLSGEDVLDLAKQFEGKTQAEMREIMKNAGYQFDDGVWCADFVSFIAGQTIGEENLPDWYKNCNRAYCPDIMKNAKANGAFVGADQAQPGDAILFDWDGDGTADHIGYVVGFNDDGSVQTIEGNTSGSNSGSQVASKTRNKGNVLGYVKLT